MGFTYDREDYTAAQLNTVWSNAVASLAAVLPPDVRILENGLKFDDLVPVENEYTRKVNGPRDVIEAISHFAALSNFSGNFIATTTGLTNVEGVTLKVRNRFNTIEKAYEYKEAIAIRPDLEGQFRTITQEQPTLVNNRASTTIDKKVFEIRTNSFTGLSMYGMGQIQVAGLTSPSFVGITTTFSVTGLTYTPTKQISNSGIGWFDDNFIDVERFSSESGFDKWFLGEATLVTETKDWLGTGFGQWNFGTSYLLGDVDTFSDINWPEGSSPSSGGSSSSQLAENITSQINGITNTFSTSEQYISGSLRVYYNGQRMVKDVTFTELTSTTFRLTFVPTSGDVLNVDYTPLY